MNNQHCFHLVPMAPRWVLLDRLVFTGVEVLHSASCHPTWHVLPVALLHTGWGTYSLTMTTLLKQSLCFSMNLEVDHGWKTLLYEQGFHVSEVLIMIWDWHLLTQAIKIFLFISQQPCAALWFLRRLKIYSQCPGLAPCQWKYQTGISQECPLEVTDMDSTCEMIS